MNVIEERGTTSTGLVSVLAALVSSFSASPHLNGKKMRDLLHLDPEAFRDAAVSALHESSDPRGYRYVVTLLTAHGLLIPLLSDPSLPLTLASTLASNAAKLDPQLHLRLIRILGDSAAETHDLPEAVASRLLELLGLIADPTALQPFLRQMLFHPSARVRSKVGLLIGRLPNGARALETLLSDDDERVRANAAEALWDHPREHAMLLLPGLLNDPHHRVVGNAIVGLYRFGDLRCIAAITRLNNHPDRLFRATGIWVMGRSKDPRYLPQLGRMLADSPASARKSLFNAVNSIKTAAAERTRNPPLKVTALRAFAPGDSISDGAVDGIVTVHIAVRGKRPFETPAIYPAGFWLTADQRPVNLLDCSEKRSDAVSLNIVLPSRGSADRPLQIAIDAALNNALEYKPIKELWSVVHYQALTPQLSMSGHLFGVNIAGDSMVAPGRTPAPGFTASFDSLRCILTNPSPSAHLPDWAAAVSAALSKQLSGRIARHLITFADSTLGIDSASIDQIRTLAQANRVSIHVLARHIDERISDLCAETGGNCRWIQSDDEIEDQLCLLLSAIKTYYSVTFSCLTATQSLPQKITVQAYNATQFGECEWRGENLA